MSTYSLSLAELDAFDEKPIVRGSESRYLCPLPSLDCQGKPRDDAHRCLCMNTVSGLWNCKRCHAKGRLRDLGEQPEKARRRVVVPGSLRSAVTSSTAAASSSDALAAEKWRAAWNATLPLEGTPGAKYLEGRGIEVEVAAASGVRFARRWQGEASVVFPLLDRDGVLVAAQGRHITGDGKRTGGPRRLGAFGAFWKHIGPLHEAAPAVIVCEAPIDALSIATAGFPALALCGREPPEWLHKACAFKLVLLATDADEPGDSAAHALAEVLQSFGARCERLRPEGSKDWNELLQDIEHDALADWLTARVFRLE